MEIVFVYEPDRFIIKNRLGNLVAEAELNVRKSILQNETCLLSSSTVDGQTWYRRLGHLNSTDMKQGLVNGMDYSDKFVTMIMSKVTDYTVKNKVTIGIEKLKRLETVTVSLESTDSVGELVVESVVKHEPLNKSSPEHHAPGTDRYGTRSSPGSSESLDESISRLSTSMLACAMERELNTCGASRHTTGGARRTSKACYVTSWTSKQTLPRRWLMGACQLTLVSSTTLSGA
ncbi:jg6853 [Pararge aegeria aegeria]|uniref:Jg6853 protein n=1 Tax=Pararge aegeria aegeria TaxID=348720 RepID=A0A8S4R016_9NEOP|nr:jg6853 [Pararge aegeria aegeria]